MIPTVFSSGVPQEHISSLTRGASGYQVLYLQARRHLWQGVVLVGGAKTHMIEMQSS